MPLPLIALALAAFGIGTTEFVIMGLLPDVARDLGVTIPAAGLLVTGYALGVVVGGPIVAILTARLPRKPALLGMIALFVLGNLLCARAPRYALLMAARVVTAFCHGSFFGVASVVAADLVEPKRRAQAIALMFTGLTVANVLGVPMGTAMGQAMGWRSTFWAVTGIGLVSALAVARWLPGNLRTQGGNLLSEFRVLRNRQVLLALAMSVLASASLFSVFTYITPILETVTGFSPRAVTGVLLVFGLGLTAGSTLGGRLADWRLKPSLIATLFGIAGILTVFAFSCHTPVPAVLTIFVWGMLSFTVVPLTQMWVVDEARNAPNLASTLNQGAFNLGNATGAWLGGLVVAAGVPLTDLSWTGVAVIVAALLVTLWSARLDRRQGRPA